MENTNQAIKTKKISSVSALIFIGSILIQILGISLWPLTRGFTELWPTLASIAAQLIGNFMLCRLIYKGVPLSVLLPLASAAIPLTASAVGIIFYGESASILKVILLISACMLIALAGRMK